MRFCVALICSPCSLSQSAAWSRMSEALSAAVCAIELSLSRVLFIFCEAVSAASDMGSFMAIEVSFFRSVENHVGNDEEDDWHAKEPAQNIFTHGFSPFWLRRTVKGREGTHDGPRNS